MFSVGGTLILANHSDVLTTSPGSFDLEPTTSHNFNPKLPARDPSAPKMASTRPLMMLARSRLAAAPLRPSQFTARRSSPATVALFSTTFARAATPAGPPPPGFRLPRPKRWDEEKNTLDKAAKYFLLLEMFRGMYVLMEQFFRPP